MAEPQQSDINETKRGWCWLGSVGLRQHKYNWWIQMMIYAVLVLVSQSIGTLLGRLYFDNGGSSQWMATLVQVAGFPILLPFLWVNKMKNTPSDPTITQPYPFTLPLIYISLGIFLALDCLLYSIGLKFLPVTTYSLICASQLGFNAIFSYFLNGQKFTPYIVNSVVLLTISSVLLVFQTDSGDSVRTSSRKYAIGFVCTICASAGYALMVCITQLAFQKIIKKENVRTVIKMTMYETLVASIVIVIGLMVSGDWKKVKGEMVGYKLGEALYLMNLIGTAITWQACYIGSIGLIFQVSSLFSNVISILGLPLAPISAVLFLGDRLTGLKVVSMVLAIWGFVSYMYQHYVDHLKQNKTSDNVEVALVHQTG